MRAIRAPGYGSAWCICEDEDQTAPARQAPDPFKDFPTIRRRIVAKYDPRAARQPLQRDPERASHALVGHEPKIRVRLAIRHADAIAAVMVPHEDPRIESDLPPLEMVRSRIARAAAVAGRDAADIELIAVSKTQSAEAIVSLLDVGQRSFGENRVQEAQAKWPALKAGTDGLRLHHVGQLQSNKADDAVRLFDAIHGVDRSSLVSALVRSMDRIGRRPACFIQVNIGDEAQKGGCAIAELPRLLGEARDAGLPVIGLMAVPPMGIEAAPYFALLAKLAGENGLGALSMGMSADYETAVMLGATHVRVGTALFGGRGA